MRIFVAGATGVLGRRTIPLLTAQGHDVTAVARSPEKAARLRNQGATPVEVDLFDAGAVTRAVSGHDVVINLATAIPPTMQMLRSSAWRMTTRLRTEAAGNLTDAALATGASRYIQEALAFAYDDHGSAWISEDEPINPVRYAEAVRTAEAHARRFDEHGDGDGVVLRFGWFYAADSSHVTDMLRMARAGLLPVTSHRDSYQSWIHLDDAATAVAAALHVPGGAYNVVEDHPLTNAEHVAVLSDLLGRRVRHLPGWLGVSLMALYRRSQRVSNRRLRDASGWRPRYPSRREGWAEVLASTAEVPAHA